MNSRATPRFWAAYRELPTDEQEARKAYRLFRENPHHPSLHFKKVHSRESIYSVRVSLGYRAVGQQERRGHVVLDRRPCRLQRRMPTAKAR